MKNTDAGRFINPYDLNPTKFRDLNPTKFSRKQGADCFLSRERKIGPGAPFPTLIS